MDNRIRGFAKGQWGKNGNQQFLQSTYNCNVWLYRLLDELSGWVRCFWVVGLLLNPVGRAFPVDVTGGGQGRAL